MILSSDPFVTYEVTSEMPFKGDESRKDISEYSLVKLNDEVIHKERLCFTFKMFRTDIGIYRNTLKRKNNHSKERKSNFIFTLDW